MNDLTQQQGFNASNFVMDSMLNSSMFEQMQRAATLFSKSGLVPGNFQNNPAACFVGLQLAGAIGCNPFMLFQGLYSISGKIALETKVAVAIANQKGVFTSPITHIFKGEGKTRSCTATATLTKSKKEVSITVDWDTVEKEGWNKKNGSKWNTMPDQMFRYRSSMWLIRTYAPEVLMGLNSLDEIEDSKLIDVTQIKTKRIDEAFAEIANPVKAEPIEQPKETIDIPKSEVKAEVNKGTGAIGPEEKIGWFWCENLKCVEPIPIDKNKILNTEMCPVCHGHTLHEAKENSRKGAADERMAFVTKGESKAVTPQTTKDASLIDTILAYGIKPSILTVYTVKAIGKNKELESLDDTEAKKLLDYIQSIKGALK